MHTIREFTTTKDCFNGKKSSIGLLCPNNSPAAPEMYKMPSSLTRTDTSKCGWEMMSTTRALTAGGKVIADTAWVERKLRPNWHFCPLPQPNTLPEEPKSNVWLFPQHTFLICSGQLIHTGLYSLLPKGFPNCAEPFCPNACTDSCSQITMEWCDPQATKVANRAEPVSIGKGTCCQLFDAAVFPNPSCPQSFLPLENTCPFVAKAKQWSLLQATWRTFRFLKTSKTTLSTRFYQCSHTHTHMLHEIQKILIIMQVSQQWLNILYNLYNQWDINSVPLFHKTSKQGISHLIISQNASHHTTHAGHRK